MMSPFSWSNAILTATGCNLPTHFVKKVLNSSEAAIAQTHPSRKPCQRADSHSILWTHSPPSILLIFAQLT
jgi:hypothetical protein